MTIKDIAKLSNVSVSTVSRVLNNHKDVSEENRAKVLAVIAQHEYVPNTVARDLVKTTSDTIGIVARGTANTFFTEVIKAINQTVRQKGYTLVVQQIESNENEVSAAIQLTKEKHLLGIIFLGGRFDYQQEEIAHLKVPFVCCTYTNSYGTLNPKRYSSVSISDEEEAYLAVRGLIEAGHREIAVLLADTNDRSISQLRYQGYCKALREAGIAQNDDMVIKCESFDVKDAYQAVTDAAEKARYTALFAISDTMAIGAIRALHDMGRPVPEACSVVAIDGLEISDYLVPKLTTRKQPAEEMGRLSVEILAGLIEGSGKNQQVFLKTSERKGGTVRNINL